MPRTVATLLHHYSATSKWPQLFTHDPKLTVKPISVLAMFPHYARLELKLLCIGSRLLDSVSKQSIKTLPAKIFSIGIHLLVHILYSNNILYCHIPTIPRW